MLISAAIGAINFIQVSTEWLAHVQPHVDRPLPDLLVNTNNTHKLKCMQHDCNSLFKPLHYSELSAHNKLLCRITQTLISLAENFVLLRNFFQCLVDRFYGLSVVNKSPLYVILA